MTNLEMSASENEKRLTEISERVDSEDMSTDELLELLEEAVNIGMDVCAKAQENVNSQIANEAKTEDERH